MTALSSLRARYLLPSGAGEHVYRGATVRYDRAGIRTVEASGSEHGSLGLLMPPLSNAHDHGRGLKTIAYGVADRAIETWVSATYTLPPVDPYLIAAAAFARMARSGIGAAVHCHLARDPATLIDEAHAVRRAADDVGLRVAFVVPLRDRHRLAYADDEAVLAFMDAAEAAAARARLKPIAPIDEQLAAVEEIARGCESERFQVQLGPVGAEWCSDALLERVAEASRNSGRRVHMHLLESRYQREWADDAYPGGIVTHLDRMRLLSERLTVAHGTWLRPEECRLLAERGVTVSINTSSNLRLRSGIAPLAQLCAAGVRFAIGLDALALDDDDDLLREMRVTRLLHAGTGFDRGLERTAVLEAACHNGAVAASSEAGEIAPGRPADLLLLSLKAAGAGVPPALRDIPGLLHTRANASSVHTLVVAGRKVVERGRVVGVDQRGIERELAARLAACAPQLSRLQPDLARFQAALERFYRAGGHRGACAGGG